MRKILSITLLSLLAATGLAAAEQPQTLKAGTVVSVDDQTLVVESNGTETTYHLAEAATVPSTLATGDVVLVRVADHDTMTTDRVLAVDEEVMVTENMEAEHAVVGSVQATSTNQLILDTTTGEQAFVVDPEKLFPPVPTPDQRVAVTYRTLELNPPRYKATGLVVLDEGMDMASNVEVSSEPVATVAQAEPEPAPRMQRAAPAPAPSPEAPAPAPAPMTEEPTEALPQTGSSLPALGLLGLTLLALGGATRFRS
ncbi:MAG: LPXTG cell wall anchor domain-containing protein [Thermoanaerobaculia bacterium]